MRPGKMLSLRDNDDEDNDSFGPTEVRAVNDGSEDDFLALNKLGTLVLDQAYVGALWWLGVLMDDTVAKKMSLLIGNKYAKRQGDDYPSMTLSDVETLLGIPVEGGAVQNLSYDRKSVTITYDLFKNAQISAQWLDWALDDKLKPKAINEALKKVLPGISVTEMSKAVLDLKQLDKKSSNFSPADEDDKEFVSFAIYPELKRFVNSGLLKMVFEFSLVPDVTEGPDFIVAGVAVGLSVKVTYPIEFGLYVTNTSRAENFSRSLMYRYVDSVWKHYYGDNDKDTPWPIRIPSPEKMVRVSRELSSKYDGFRPRVDPKGWTVMPDGSLRRFDPTNRSTDGSIFVDYLKAMDRLLDEIDIRRKKGETVDFQSELAALSKKTIGGKIILADWASDSLLYGTQDGSISVSSLSNARALDPQVNMKLMIFPLMHPRVGMFVDRAIQRLEDFQQARKSKAMEKWSKSDAPTYQEQNRINDNFPSPSILAGRIRETGGDNVRIHHLALCGLGDSDFFQPLEVEDDDFSAKNTEAYRRADRVRGWLKQLKLIAEQAWADQASLFGDDNHKASNHSTGPNSSAAWVIEMMATMTEKEYGALRVGAAEEGRKASFDGKIPKSVTLPALDPKASKVKGLLMSQAVMYRALENQPRRVIVGCDAGGGKGIVINCIDALNSVDKSGGAVRPLIVCPKNLTYQVISEIVNTYKGKVFAFPLNPDSLLRIIKRRGASDNPKVSLSIFENMVAWLKSFPTNTIFVTGYSDLQRGTILFDDLETPLSMISSRKSGTSSHFALLMGALNFQYINFDESQFVKNMDAVRTKVSGYLAGRSTLKRVSSGTVLHNGIADYTGQCWLMDPTIFGSPKQTADILSQIGLSPGPETLARLRRSIVSTTAILDVKRSSWAYALPDMETSVHYVNLTERQTAFYDALLAEALVKFEKDKGKRKKDGRLPGGEDETLLDAEGDVITTEDEEDLEEASLRTYLSKIEIFLVAPPYAKGPETQAVENKEQDLTYANWVGGRGKGGSKWPDAPKGEDLISPKTREAINIINAHYQRATSDPGVGKVLVLGYNRAASRHFMDYYSKLGGKHMAVRYTAGDEDVLRQFIEDPAIKVMVADEKTMNVGRNLQVVGRIIRLQPVWSPGEFEQSIARMYRPDLADVYRRSKVYVDWIMCRTWSHLSASPGQPVGNPTLDAAKASRMFSKAYFNALDSFGDHAQGEGIASTLSFEARSKLNLDWTRRSAPFTELTPRTISLEFLTNMTDQDINPYFGAWEMLNGHLQLRNEVSRVDLARRIMNEYPEADLIGSDGRIKDFSKLIKLSMTAIVEKPLKGADPVKTNQLYVPWQDRSDPPDPLGLGLVLLGDKTLEKGQAVMTEHGPGSVIDFNETSAKVEFPFGSERVPLTRIAIAATKDGVKRLVGMVGDVAYSKAPPNVSIPGQRARKALDDRNTDDAGDKKLITLPKSPASLPLPKAADKKPEKPARVVRNMDEDDKADLRLRSVVLNGMPALTVSVKSSDHVEELHSIMSSAPSSAWVEVPQFVSVAFTGKQGAIRFLTALLGDEEGNKDGKFACDETKKALLFASVATLVSSAGSSLKAEKAPNQTLIRNFFIATHRKLRPVDGEPQVDPFWVTHGTNVRLAFCVKSHDPKVIRWIIQQGKGIQGVTKVAMNTPFYANFFRTQQDAAKKASLFKQVVDGFASKIKKHLHNNSYPVNAKDFDESVANSHVTYRALRAGRK